MGATLSEQRDKHEEDEEQLSGQDEGTEDSAEDTLLQKNWKISGQNGKAENQTDESDERDLVDVGSGFVTLKEDASDMTDSIQEGDDSENISKQIINTDERSMKGNEENEANDNVNDAEIGFKKIFRFGGLKFTLKKDKAEKIDTDEPLESEQDKSAAGPAEESWDTTDLSPVKTNEHEDEEEKKNERIRGDPSAGFTENKKETTPQKELMGDVPRSPEPEEPMSPVRRFFSQGIFGSLRKKKKDEGGQKEDEDELKSLLKVAETTKEDTTCTCLDVSNGTIDEDKNGQLYKKEESKPAAEGDIMNCLEQDKVQASPFRKLFRKLSLRRQSETKPGDTNLLEPGENSSENPQLSTEFIKSQKEQETKVVETQPADEMMDSHDESKKKSDSTVSWENLLCVRSGKTRARKTSDSEDETHEKKEVHRRVTESPFESSTEGDHLTSSNEQGASPAEEDSGSTWKSFKKLVTPKRKSRMEESGSAEQIQSDAEISKDESSCSLRKLISGRKKIKLDGQQEYISSDEGSKGTGTDIEDDDTPGVVPLSEYEIAEPEMLKEVTEGTKRESEKEKEMQPVSEEDKPIQIQPSYNIKPLSFDAGPIGVPIPTEYMEELTEFLSKHQQLSDIPEEGIIEESVATQYDTLADDTVDMTADAVTAPEHASEHTEDETSEMVSAVSQLSDSPKTSGNVTPLSPVHHMGECDTIFQDVVESVSMVPTSMTTRDQAPETQTASVSQFIVESNTPTETKVLVTHKKEEATSICIGIGCEEIKATEVVHPLLLIEGISEISHTVPTEFVSEDLPEEPKLAGIASDNVSEAKIQEIKTMLHEVLLLDEQNTNVAETAKKSKQVVMVENVQEEVSPVVQIEDDSTKLLNGLRECTPVHAAVSTASQLLERQIITQDINTPESVGPLQPALEESVYEQLTQNTQIPFEVEKEHRVPDVESSAADVEQLVLVTDVTEPVLYSVVASKSDPALNQVSAKTEAGALVSDVKCSESIAPICNVIPIPGSVKIEMDLEHKAQMKNDSPPHYKDSHTIQVKVKSTELQTENKNAETVPTFDTTTVSADAFKNIDMIGEEEKAKQKIEPTSAKTVMEIGEEKIEYSPEAESLSEIIDKPTEKREGKESQLNTIVMFPSAMTSEKSASKETEDMSDVILGPTTKEHTEADTVHMEDCKSKHTADDEIGMLTLNTAETNEETKKPPAIFEQPRVYEDMPLNGVQPPATNELIADSQTKSKDSAKSEAVKRSCVDDEPDKLLANEQEDNETANLESTTELNTVEIVKTFPEVEPHHDPDEQGIEVLISKPEMFQATESSHDATKAMVKMTETISTFMSEEQKKECNTAKQVATRQCFNEIDTERSLDQSAMSDTLSAEKQEDKETAKPEVNTKTIAEDQEAETGLSSAQTLSPILKKNLEKEDANITIPDIVETIQHTSEVPGLDVPTTETSTVETETLVRTCVEKDVEAQGSVVTSLKEDTNVKSLVLSSSEAQLKNVISVVQKLDEQTASDIPVIHKATVGQFIQEPEMSMVAQEIKEIKLETTDAVDVTALKIPVAEITRVEVTKQITKGAVLTSESKSTSSKEGKLSTVTTFIKEPTVASCVTLTNVSEVSVVETPTVVPAEIHRPTVVPVIETLADNRAVKEVEMPVTEPEVKERLCDAQAADNIEVKHLPMTEITEQVAGETFKTFLKFEPQLKSEQPQKEFLSLKSEERQAPESSHKSYEENNQATGADQISETISSVIHEEETRVECKKSDQPVKTGLGVDGEPVRAMDHVSEIVAKDKAEFPEGIVISEPEGSGQVLEVTKASAEVAAEVEHEFEMTGGFKEDIVCSDTSKQEEVSVIDVENAAVTERNMEQTASSKLKEESTIIISKGQTLLTSEPVAESLIVSENKNEAEMLPQEMSKLRAETLDVVESKTNIKVESEIQAETPAVASPVKTPVVISAEKTGNVEALALTSEIKKLQSDLKSVSEPEVSTGSIQQKTPIVVSDIQTVTGLSPAQTHSPILQEGLEKEDANITTPDIVEVTEPKSEMLIVTETIQHTLEVPGLNVPTTQTSTVETETLVRTCVEKDVEAQGSVVTSLKEDTDVNSLVLSSSEAQLKNVISVIQKLEKQTASDIPVIHKATVGQFLQEPEMSMMAQEIKEIKLETTDAVDVTAIKIPVAEVTRVEVTKQITKAAVLTSVVPEFESTSSKESMVSTVTTLIEEKKVASCVKLTTVSEVSVVETPTVVPAEVRRPTVVPVIETLDINTAVKEVKMPVTEAEVKERLCDAQAADNIEVKHLPMTEIKVTEIIKQAAEDVKKTTNLIEGSKSPEELRGQLQEMFIPAVRIVEPLSGPDDDIWEDAIEDIKDDPCSSTKASSAL